MSHIHWVEWGTGTPKDRDELRGERFESVKGEYVILSYRCDIYVQVNT